jgi:putative oxidoreductase
MKKIFSVKCGPAAFNTGMLILRVGAGVLMIPHGYDKLVKFSEMAPKFMNFMGLGSTLSLSLVIFAEFFCGMFLVLGLFTRLAAIPLIIDMAVATFMAHNGDIFGEAEHSALFMIIFITILLCGPGRASVDGMIK